MKTRGKHVARLTTALALFLGLTACIDFAADEATCRQNGRCGTDGGPAGGGGSATGGGTGGGDGASSCDKAIACATAISATAAPSYEASVAACKSTGASAAVIEQCCSGLLQSAKESADAGLPSQCL
jgi:hypothetical protein